MVCRKVTTDSPAMKRIVAVLEENGPLSRDDIADLAHISLKTLKSGGYMKTLIEAELIHVFKYERSQNGPAYPIYRAGPDPRKQKARPPKAFSPAEKSRRWKEKTGYSERRKERRRVAAMGSLAIAAGYRITNNERRNQA